MHGSETNRNGKRIVDFLNALDDLTRKEARVILLNMESESRIQGSETIENDNESPDFLHVGLLAEVGKNRTRIHYHFKS